MVEGNKSQKNFGSIKRKNLEPVSNTDAQKKRKYYFCDNLDISRNSADIGKDKNLKINQEQQIWLNMKLMEHDF